MSSESQIPVSVLAGNVSQMALAIVFLLSSLPKLRQPRRFARGVVEYRILPSNVAYLFGLALVPTEVFLAASLLTGWLATLALPVATGLMLVFFVGVAVNLRRGRRIACGCFGQDSEEISPRTLARLLLLLSVAGMLLTVFRDGVLASFNPASIPIATLAPAYLLQTITLAASLLIAGSWVLRLPELVQLARFLVFPKDSANVNTRQQLESVRDV